LQKNGIFTFLAFWLFLLFFCFIVFFLFFNLFCFFGFFEFLHFFSKMVTSRWWLRKCGIFCFFGCFGIFGIFSFLKKLLKWIYSFFFYYIDRETGEVNELEEVDIQKLDDLKISWESKDRIWEIDWTLIWYELKNWEPPWLCMKLADFLKVFFIALAAFTSSFYDVYTDVQLAYYYFNGDVRYDFTFANHTDPLLLGDTVPLIHVSNCTHLETGNYFGIVWTSYFCFSKNNIFGIISLIPIILPGILLSSLTAFDQRSSPIRMWICVMISPMVAITFPIIFFTVKVKF